MRPDLPLTASSASALAAFTSNFTPACLLKRSSARCEAAFQLPSTAPVLQPTRRSSACSARGKPSLLLFGEPRFLRGSGLVLFDLFDLLGSNAGFLRRLGRRSRPRLFRLLRTLSGKAGLLLLCQPRFIYRRPACLFGSDLLQ